MELELLNDTTNPIISVDSLLLLICQRKTSLVCPTPKHVF